MICRNCGAGLEAGKIDSSLGVVTCSHCGSLHKIPGDNISGSTGTGSGATATTPDRLEVELPKKFKVKRSAGAMEVSWKAGGIFPALMLLIIGGGSAFVAVTSALLLLLIPSAGIFYFALTRAVNTYRIRVDSARLEVTQGPLPLPGSRKLDASDIVQLFVTERESRTEKRNGGDHRVSVRKYYPLSANTRSEGRVQIFRGLRNPHQALWLEQEIEQLLGIVDKRVAGDHVG